MPEETTQTLIERVLRSDLPIDPAVLDAMMRVDRKEFLPEWAEDQVKVVDAKELDELNNFTFQILYQGAAKFIRGYQDSDELPGIIGRMASTLHGAKSVNITVRRDAYKDRPIEIGYGQTCSQPSLVGSMITQLQVKPGMRVCEVGSGCGYAAAVLGELGAQVVGVDRKLQLVNFGRKNLRKHFGPEYGKRAQLYLGNGFNGFPKKGPYDRIMFSAQPVVHLPTYPFSELHPTFKPDVIAQSLRDGTGIILYPYKLLHKLTYENGELKEHEKIGPEINFVPLVAPAKN